MIKKILLFLSILLTLALTGCAGGDAALGKFVLARGLAENGQPADAAPVKTFTAGETVYLAIEFTGGYEGLEARIRWYRADTTLASQTLTLARQVDSLDPLWLSAKLKTEPDWPAGEYRCDLFVPDQGTQTLTFQLEH